MRLKKMNKKSEGIIIIKNGSSGYNPNFNSF